MQISEFLTEITEIQAHGRETEHSYRKPLQDLIQSFAPKNAHVLNEPKRIPGIGAVDFEITLNHLPIAHIEAKDTGVDLRSNKGRNKIQRDTYLAAYGNLCYTNGLEWDFYNDGTRYESIRIGDLLLGIQPLPENFEKLANRLREFLSKDPEKITSHEFLAKRMAAKAQIIKEVLESALFEDENSKTELYGQFQAFQEVLIHDITIPDFADLYAETIAYGMFAARLHDPTPKTFSRHEALERLPKSNPFLRKLFTYIGHQDLDPRVVREIDQLVTLFLAVEPENLAKSFANTNGRHDPYIHFYETFLALYNPAKRKSRGVWFTPEPVVKFIVRAVDQVLKTEFGLQDGLADTSKITFKFDKGNLSNGKADIENRQLHRVQILDPATGTGTFLAEVIKHIEPTITQMGKGMMSRYIHDELIDRLHGFELLMASYAMCHMKLDLMFSGLGYVPPADNPKRLGVYLTNSLEEGQREVRDLFMFRALTEEAHAANEIKRNRPIMCVIGNPPYSVSSQNQGEWINNLMADYKRDLGERNIQPLSDDYLKFIRMSEEMVNKNGSGIIGMITNNSYMDGLIHRAMRKRLMESFDKIYVLDLHGNAKKKETAPDGSKDDNVFDIMQGVGILIAVKTGKKKAGALAEVYHGDLWGKRAGKYAALDSANLLDGGFTRLEAPAPNYFFVPKDFAEQGEYDKGFSIEVLFLSNSAGIVTSRDQLVIAPSLNELRSNISTFFDKTINDEQIAKQFNLKSTKHWDLNAVRNSCVLDFGKIKPICYRPFDNGYIYYEDKFLERSRKALANHFWCDENNIGIAMGRQNKSEQNTQWIAIRHPSERKFAEYSVGSSFFPLYLYPDENADAPDMLARAKRTPNLDPKLVANFAKSVGLSFISDHEDEGAGAKGTFHPLDLFDYIYAVLHSPAYRETYREFLKIDFPRVPYPKDAEDFWRLVAHGGVLRRLHLMEGAEIGAPICTFEGDDTAVDRPRYEDGKVWINATAHFANVPERAWAFYIGGYQPAQKWLKDRKARELAFADIRHYMNIITILDKTARVMEEIDGEAQS